METRLERMDARQIGQRVKELRLERGWSLRELAQRAGISHNLVNVLERGEQTRPSLDKMQRIGDALGVPFYDLVGLNGADDNHDDPAFSEFRRQWVLLSYPERGLVLDFMRLLVMRSKERGDADAMWRVLGSQGDEGGSSADQQVG